MKSKKETEILNGIFFREKKNFPEVFSLIEELIYFTWICVMMKINYDD